MKFGKQNSLYTISGVLVLVAVLSLMVSLGGVSTQLASAQAPEGVSVSQSSDSTTAAPGTNVTLTVDLTVPGNYHGTLLDVDIPSDWEVVSQSSDPSAAGFKSSEIQWLWLHGGNKTVDFTVHVPSDASDGSYTLVANGSSENPDTDEREWDETSSSVTVESSSSVSTQTATPGGGGGSGTSTQTTSPPPTSPPTTASPPTATSTRESSPDRDTTTAPGDKTTSKKGTTGGTANTPLPTRTAARTTTSTLTATPGQPGFGIVLASIALLAASLLALRRIP